MPSLLFFCTTSYADIYTYKDSNNQFYFTDNKMDASYRLLSVYRPQLTEKTNKSYSLERYKQNKKRYLPLIYSAAKQYQLDPKLLHAIIDTESAFNPNAVSKVGAVGLMQLMPKTAQSLGVKNRRDPKQNIQGGALYFSQLMQQFKNQLRLAIAAYNAGPTAIKNAGNKVPNYPETKRYVAKVLNKYKTLQ
jgi:soluble lytic murein transglycosylase-like protein